MSFFVVSDDFCSMVNGCKSKAWHRSIQRPIRWATFAIDFSWPNFSAKSCAFLCIQEDNNFFSKLLNTLHNTRPRDKHRTSVWSNNPEWSASSCSHKKTNTEEAALPWWTSPIFITEFIVSCSSFVKFLAASVSLWTKHCVHFACGALSWTSFVTLDFYQHMLFSRRTECSTKKLRRHCKISSSSSR